MHSGHHPNAERKLDVSDHRLRRVPSKTWRELIKKIREVDPLSCPRCGHEINIISLIHGLDVTERILRHPGLWKQPPAPHEGKIKATADWPLVLDHFDDSWPGYKDHVIIYH